MYNSYSENEKNFKNEVINFIVSQLSEPEKAGYEKEMERLKGKRVSALSPYVPDMELPKGCEELGWDKHTVIDVRYIFRFDTLRRLYPMMKKSYKSEKYDLIIIYKPTPSILPPETEGMNLKIYSKNEIFRLGTKKVSSLSANNLRSTSSSKVEYTNYIKAFRNNISTLFIGAGVSQSAGLPGWQGLLKGIAGSITETEPFEEKKMKKLMNVCDSSTIVEARFLKTLLRPNSIDEEELNSNFVKCVKKAMYRSEVVQSKLLSTIVNLVIANRNSVQGIITYNFDNLLEQEFEKREKVKMKDFSAPIFYKNTVIPKGTLPIIHVHGIIPEKGNYGSEIILSEDAYHGLYNNPYSWTNVVQLYALQNTTCFFIGLSMTDPSLRRLLEASKRTDKSMHYAFLKMDKENWDAFGTDTSKEVIDEMFLKLGVKVVWYETYDELPDYIEKMGKQKSDSLKDK